MKRAERAYKFTTRKRQEYLKLLSEGSRRVAAAEAVGVKRQTVSNHIAADPEFAAAVDEAEMAANQIVEYGLFQSAQAGNVSACVFWLTNRDPDRWQDRRNLGINGSLNLSHGITDDKIDAELQRLLENRGKRIPETAHEGNGQNGNGKA